MTWDVCALARAPGETVGAFGDGLAKTELGLSPDAVTHGVVRTKTPNHLTLEVDGARLCGVVGESDPATTRGVVLDAMGINGARFATPLAWDESAFVAELRRRSPDLVILEYGTNEESDAPPRLDDVGHDVESLVVRMKQGAPTTSCLVLGPTERADRLDAIYDLRDAIGAASERAGCAFWDTFQTMGGRGSMRAWQSATPQLAQHDGIHLTPDGYTKLAELLFADLTRELPASGGAP